MILWNSAVLAMKKPFSFGWEKGDGGGYEIRICDPSRRKSRDTSGLTAEFKPFRGFMESDMSGLS